MVLERPMTDTTSIEQLPHQRESRQDLSGCASVRRLQVLSCLVLAGCAASAASEAGCATPAASEATLEPEVVTFIDAELRSEASGAAIWGIVRDRSGAPVVDAVVVLQSVALHGDQSRVTNERGIYAFDQLPPGSYRIDVFFGKANVSHVVNLPKDTRLRANFSLDPDSDQRDCEIIVYPRIRR
jgi:hypothetical protein